jgi:hypothetical protein
MKLAEALGARADLQTRIEQLKQRLLRNAKVQEGDQPSEQPEGLLAEVDRLAADLTRLIQQINLTNSQTPLGNEGSISDAIARRDVLRLRHAIYRDLANAATPQQARNTRSEIRFLSTVNVADIQASADDLAREHRELDARIQEANWLTELIENRQ